MARTGNVINQRFSNARPSRRPSSTEHIDATIRPSIMTQKTLVLASTSPYRRELLSRLGLDFETASPRVDETRRPGEAPIALVERLAEAKARAVAEMYPDALIIGSDQVACVDPAADTERVLGKPGNRARAIEQLSTLAGRAVVFYTGVCLLDASSGRAHRLCEPYRVFFRALTPAQIASYVERERPFDCAGSFKSEGLGIALFERLEGDDPNALIGLPMIRLIGLLAGEGLDVLGPAARRADPL